jgi:hypothetical protein
MYGKGYSSSRVLIGKVPPPQAAQLFLGAVQESEVRQENQNAENR